MFCLYVVLKTSVRTLQVWNYAGHCAPVLFPGTCSRLLSYSGHFVPEYILLPYLSHISACAAFIIYPPWARAAASGNFGVGRAYSNLSVLVRRLGSSRPVVSSYRVLGALRPSYPILFIHPRFSSPLARGVWALSGSSWPVPISGMSWSCPNPIHPASILSITRTYPCIYLSSSWEIFIDNNIFRGEFGIEPIHPFTLFGKNICFRIKTCFPKTSKASKIHTLLDR